MYDAGVRYEDLVGAAEAVVTKPGYGIISECIANDAAVLYTVARPLPRVRRAGGGDAEYVRQRLHLPRRPVRRQVGVAPGQAARRRRRPKKKPETNGADVAGRHPAEGARQAAERNREDGRRRRCKGSWRSRIPVQGRLGVVFRASRSGRSGFEVRSVRPRAPLRQSPSPHGELAPMMNGSKRLHDR